MNDSSPEPKSLPLSQWPKRDRQLWEHAIKPADLFEDQSIAGGWTLATRQLTLYRYGYWLAWLRQRGLLDENQPIQDRVTSELVLQFADDLRSRVTPVSVFMVISGIKRMLDAIAPSPDRQWLLVLCRNLKRAAAPSRDKHTRVVDTSLLFALGLRLLEEASQTDLTSIFDVTNARDGLIIALLALRPLRISNFEAIEIGRHLRLIGDAYWLVFDKFETKTRRPIEVPCPSELTPHIERYLQVYRPILLRRAAARSDTQRLWINRRGTVMRHNAIRRQIETHTRQAFGRTINPHLFRDCAATSIAVHDPEHVRIASVILGHARLSTTEKYYNQAQMLSASREYGRALVGMRRNLRARGRPK